MKLKGLLAAAMMVAAISSMGCKSSGAGGDGDVAPEENPDTAPVVTAQAAPEPAHAEHAEKAGNPGIEHDAYLSFGLKTYVAPVAPPAPRVEVIGVSPGPRYFWAPGYYRWSGREHVWYPGRYMLRREGYTWVNPYWRSYGGRWQYYRGYWRR